MSNNCQRQACHSGSRLFATATTNAEGAEAEMECLCVPEMELPYIPGRRHLTEEDVRRKFFNHFENVKGIIECSPLCSRKVFEVAALDDCSGLDKNHGLVAYTTDAIPVSKAELYQSKAEGKKPSPSRATRSVVRLFFRTQVTER